MLSPIEENDDYDESESDGDNSSVPKTYARILLVKNPGLIYVALDNKILLNQQRELFHSLQSFYQSKLKTKNSEATVGSICIVYHQEKGQYYRAIVTDELANDCLMVLLRDIAEELIVPIDNVYAVEKQFLQTCEGSVRCHLANISPVGEDPSKWSSTSIDYLNDVLSKGKILLAKDGLVDKHRKSLPVVMWYTKVKLGSALEPTKIILHNINNLLVNRGLACKSSVIGTGLSLLDIPSNPETLVNSEVSLLQNKQPEISQEIDTAVDQPNKIAKAITIVMEESEEINSKVGNDTSVVSLDWLPPEPFILKQFEAIATYVDEFANIYIHNADSEEALKKIESDMKSIFDTIPPELEGTVWIPGQLCTVRYSITNCWYRGKIVSVNGDIVNVRFIDYGNVEECRHEDLRLKISHIEIPTVANQVHLYNVICKSDKWRISDLDELHATVVDKRISVVLKGNVWDNASLPAKILIGGIYVNKEIVLLSTNLQYGFNRKLSIRKRQQLMCL